MPRKHSDFLPPSLRFSESMVSCFRSPPASSSGVRTDITRHICHMWMEAMCLECPAYSCCTHTASADDCESSPPSLSVCFLCSSHSEGERWSQHRKLWRLLRYKQVCSQCVVGTFKVVVKNHSREPVSQRTTSQDAPTISRARSAFTEVRSRGHVQQWLGENTICEPGRQVSVDTRSRKTCPCRS